MKKQVLDWWLGGASFDSDYQAWLTQIIADGGTEPSASVKTAQNALVVSLKAAGLWSRAKAGWFHHCGDLTTCRRNLFSPSTFRITVVGSPDFSEGNGSKSGASNGYFNTGYNVNQYAGIESDLTIVQYISTTGSAATQASVGCRGGSAPSEFIKILRPFSFGSSGQFSNYTLALTSFGTSSTYKGLYCLTHDGTNDIVYKNGSKTSAVATPQAPALSQPFFILAKNAAGAVQERFTNAYVAYTFFFNRFNDSDESSLRTILTTYNTAAGLP